MSDQSNQQSIIEELIQLVEGLGTVNDYPAEMTTEADIQRHISNNVMNLSTQAAQVETKSLDMLQCLVEQREQDIQKREQDMQALTERFKKLSSWSMAHFEEFKKRITEKTNALEQAEKQLKDKKKELTEAEKKASDAQREKGTLQEQLTKVHADVARLTRSGKKITEIEELLKKAEAASNEAQESARKTKGTLNEAQQQLQKAIDEKDKIDKELVKVKEQLRQATQRRSQAEVDLPLVKEELRVAKEQRNTAQRALGEATTASHAHAETAEKLKRAEADLAQARTSLQETKNAHATELQNLRAEHEQEVVGAREDAVKQYKAEQSTRLSRTRTGAPPLPRNRRQEVEDDNSLDAIRTMHPGFGIPNIPQVSLPDRPQRASGHVGSRSETSLGSFGSGSQRSLLTSSAKSFSQQFGSIFLRDEVDMLRDDDALPPASELRPGDGQSSDKRPGSGGIMAQQPPAVRQKSNTSTPMRPVQGSTTSTPAATFPAPLGSLSAPAGRRIAMPATRFLHGSPNPSSKGRGRGRGKATETQRARSGSPNKETVAEADPAELTIGALVDGEVVDLEDINPDDPEFGDWLRGRVQEAFKKDAARGRHYKWVNTPENNLWCYRANTISFSASKWQANLERKAACTGCSSGATPCIILQDGLLVVLPRQTAVDEPMDWTKESTWVGTGRSGRGRPRKTASTPSLRQAAGGF